MPLNLSPEDQAEYARLQAPNELRKQAALAAGDDRAAKKARQYQSALYNQFAAKELPPPPPDKYDIENAMSVEQRLDRIESALKLGAYSPDW